MNCRVSRRRGLECIFEHSPSQDSYILLISPFGEMIYHAAGEKGRGIAYCGSAF